MNLLDERVSAAAAPAAPPAAGAPRRRAAGADTRPFRADARGALLALALLLLLAERFVAPPARAGRLP